MAEPLIIPTLADGTRYYEQRTQLDGTEYLFRFMWNPRRNRWAFDLTDVDENPIILGQSIVPDLDLLRRSVVPQKPPGLLVCIKTQEELEAPGLETLGNGFILAYLEANDA